MYRLFKSRKLSDISFSERIMGVAAHIWPLKCIFTMNYDPVLMLDAFENFNFSA